MSNVADSYCSTTALFDDQSGVEDSCAEEERRQDATALTAEERMTGSRVEEAKRALYVSTARLPRLKWMGCSQCRWRQAVVLALGIFLTLSALTLVIIGAIRSREHATLKIVHVKQPIDLKAETGLAEANFTIAQLIKLTSLSQEKPVIQSSSSLSSSSSSRASDPEREKENRAVDGFADSCTETDLEQSPWLRIDLLHDTAIANIRILGDPKSDFSGLQVEVSSESNITKTASQCRVVPGGYKEDSLDVRVSCPSGTVGRFLPHEGPGERMCSTLAAAGRKRRPGQVVAYGLPLVTRPTW
ncbi:fucolectin [Plakobranchus ocellatus]|uniref:Fucolectin n=1 Tax=Plakobranchus ocellatus TaxID=259542 RepID=A0AAV4BIT2_9GAST|nr:fucolectin [Plakobranchus ocellatus]